MAVRDTRFIWDDQSQIPSINDAPAADNFDRPVLMTVFASNKGPEKLQKSLSGKDFFALYGDTPNFAKYGQPLLQAARIANAGGLQYCKRVVALDSKLANISLIANVMNTSIQDTNKDGKPLYSYKKSTGEVNTDYWVETTDQDDIAKSSGEYDQTADYIAGDVVEKTVDTEKKYYKAIQDALAANEDAKLGAIKNEKVFITTPTYVDDNGATAYADPEMHEGTKIKYRLSSLAAVSEGDPQKNNTNNIDKVFNDIIDLSFANKDSMFEHKEVASTYWTKYDRTGWEDNALTTKLITAEQWRATTEYYPGQICKVGSAYYICNVQNSGKNPTISSQNVLSKEDADKNSSKTDKNSKNYILFTITDTGRGVSDKSIRIYADTYIRKPVNYVKYILEVIENNDVIESIPFTMNENITESSDGTEESRHNLSLEESARRLSTNIMVKFYADEFNKFIQDVTDNTPNTNEYEAINGDILFGFDRYGQPDEDIIIDATSDKLNELNGTLLSGGDNGSFGYYPITLKGEVNEDGTEETLSIYDKQVLSVFNGDYSDDIFDLDNTRIDAIFDASYKKPIKNAIAKLVNFREDCFFFRDYGNAGNTDFNSIASEKEDNDITSRFIADYVNNYKTIDPYSKKRISVSATYSLAPLFVNHYMTGVSRPFCGIKYGITYNENELVPGTINFSPKRTPKTDDNINTYDQKQWFDDRRLNYIAYYDGIPTMETETTSQSISTQLSDIHNVLLVQKLMHEIRKECPKNRYTFISGDDYAHYKTDIEAILNKYSNLFDSISIGYVEDDRYKLNGIFYAVIRVSFSPVIKSEIFKLTAFNKYTQETSSASTTTNISSN